ncbi:Putative ATP-dependent RNA helicase ucp12 [Savitreella phatthalungensis]
MGKSAQKNRSAPATAKQTAAQVATEKTRGRDICQTVSGKQVLSLRPISDVPVDHKPSAKAIVANASWTGKLPTALLSEYCQKHKWQKPEFAVGIRHGKHVIYGVTLARKNPRSNEVATVVLKPQADEVAALRDLPMASALEARNFAAVWALHRVANRLNWSMQLPSEHRGLWRTLEGIRKTVANAAQWRYQEDPWIGQAEHDKIMERHESIGRHVNATDQQCSPVVPTLFANVPEVVISKEMRKRMAQTLRQLQIGLTDGQKVKSSDVEHFVRLGFREAHAQEALSNSSSVSAALEFLLLFVPEDDLPARFLPPSHLHEISGSNFDQDGLRRELVARRLISWGYATETVQRIVQDLSKTALDQSSLSLEQLAGVYLQERLMDGNGPRFLDTNFESERFTLKNIYEEVKFDGPSFELEISKGITLRCLPPPQGYDTPVIGLQYNERVPSWLKLSVLQKLLAAAKEFASEGWMFGLVDTAKESVPFWMNEVEPLLALSSMTVAGVNRLSRRPAKKKETLWTFSAPLLTSPSEATPGRKALPAWSARGAVVSAVNTGRVVVVSGETGSGKSTQVPQFLLDGHPSSRIICTQPRRISAISLAERVSQERAEMDVAFTVRGESSRTVKTRLEYVTTGVLLRRMISMASVERVTHIIVDEVHERSVESDFLLAILRDALDKLPQLKIILMSASFDADLFCRYFGGCEHVNIPGRTFPVEISYLDDHDFGTLLANGANLELIDRYLQIVDTRPIGDAVLVFLPGVADIVAAVSRFGSYNRWCLPLHAGLSGIEQRKVFRHPPAGLRKVIFATNIAETSITIDDVVVVIDSGRVKQMEYEDVMMFRETWISQAASKQRHGRAGRTRSGVALLCYTRALQAVKMPKHTVPEILRVPLEQLCLSILAMGREPRRILQSVISPPETRMIDVALNLLVELGLKEENENALTELGRLVSLIPADLRVGKFLVLAHIFGGTERASIIAGCLSRSPFKGRVELSHPDGDVFAMEAAFNAWQAGLRPDNVSDAAVREIDSNAAQYRLLLSEIGLISVSEPSNKVIAALLAASLPFCRVAWPDRRYLATAHGAIERDTEMRSVKFYTQKERVFLHPSSTLFRGPKGDFVSFLSKTMTTKLYVQLCQPTSALAVMLLTRSFELDPHGRGVTIDGWARVAAWPKFAVFIDLLRRHIAEMLRAQFEGNRTLGREMLELMVDLIEGQSLLSPP